ncbi:MAG TPA: DUF2461 domain-containing protein [Sphingobacteriaceae bacterium]
MIIEKSTFQFLKKLSANNNREWFNTHKQEYENARQNIENFVDALIARMNTHDDIETPTAKKSLYRIYNDVRFSEDKTPYNPRFAGYLKRRKPFLRGGYYYWIRPGGTHIGCGFAYPNADDLLRIRKDISSNYDQWKKMLSAKAIQKVFGDMQGSQVKTAPRGFSKDDPGIGLLRYKQFWFEHSFSDSEALANDFIKKMDQTYKIIRPVFDYFSEILTTDENGEPLNRR